MMRSTPAWGVSAFLTLVIAILAFPQTVRGQAGISSEPPTGNYCISCHTPGDDRLNAPLTWVGGIDHELISACPALTELREEVYQSERLMAAIARGSGSLQGPQTESIERQLLGVRESFARLEQQQVNGRQAPVNDIKVLRYRLGNTYIQLNRLRDLLIRSRITNVVIIVTIFFVVSLAWGYQNAQRLGRFAQQSNQKPKTVGIGRVRVRPGTIIAVVGVFIFFSLPIFRPASQPMGTVSEAARARQESLDRAGRVAKAADQASARAWMMGRIGASWAALDPAQGEAALAAALDTLAKLEADSLTFWGEARTVEESAVGAEIAQARANLAAHRITVAASSAWAYRAIASEWAVVNPTVATELLGQAVEIAQANKLPFYRDLDLRAIAVTWAELDPEQGLAVATMVSDPGLRAWAFWEMGEYDLALVAAREVTDTVGRVRALREVARYSGNVEVFASALATAAEITDSTARAYALSDLTAAWAIVDPAGAARAASLVDETYPGARAYALFQVGSFSEAWETAEAIDDELERSKAQQIIVSAWAPLDPEAAQAAAMQIPDLMFQGAALRDVVSVTGSLDTAITINILYHQIEALTALGAYQQASELAGDLRETYPLRGLAIAWAKTDPQAALSVVDALSQPEDKAEALWVIALTDPTMADVIYDRILELARATQRAGDPLAASRALFDLAEALIPFDAERAAGVYAEALNAANVISTRY